MLEGKPTNQWVQTEREAHEAWAGLITKAPNAAKLMHLLTARVGEHNGVVISHKNLARLMGVKSTTTVKTALAVLESDRWIEIRQVGDRGTINAYILNDRVVWSGSRDKIRYSMFSANVIISDDEQPDRETLSDKAVLRRVPSLYPQEQQLPSGAGLPPPSQPALPSLEPALPATRKPMYDPYTGQRLTAYDPETGELLD